MKNFSRTALIATGFAVLTACASTGGGDTVARVIENPDQVTCRTKVKTGTRIGVKECRTNRSWAESQRRSRAYADSISRAGNQTNNMPGAGN